MSNVKPYKIVIEWRGQEDFYFSCDYAHAEAEKNGHNPGETRTFPFMAQAMGNVLRKLRKEHISFPLFLVALAFNHRNLLLEIDQLLHLLHLHLEKEQIPGTFACHISSSKDERSSCPAALCSQVMAGNRPFGVPFMPQACISPSANNHQQQSIP
jgi:hypothetical protein